MTPLAWIVTGWLAASALIALVVWSLCVAAALADRQLGEIHQAQRQADADQRWEQGLDEWLERRASR